MRLYVSVCVSMCMCAFMNIYMCVHVCICVFKVTEMEVIDGEIYISWHKSQGVTEG